MVNKNKRNIGAVLQPVFAILVALPAISSLGYMMLGSHWDVLDWERQYGAPPMAILGVGIGMSELEVKIFAGEPAVFKDHSDVWFYADGDLYVRFNDEKKVSAVCYPPADENPIVRGKMTEKEIKKRFGDPANESIHESGLRKMMNYDNPQYSFGIQLNTAQLFCVHDGKGMIYDKEYTGS